MPVAIVVAIVGGLLWYESRSSDGVQSEFGTVELPAGLAQNAASIAAEKGKLAPDFLLETIDGDTLRLSDLRGQPVLVNFWATWCVSCRQEIPELIEAYETNRSAGFVVVGVNLQEANERAGEFVDEFGIDFPVVMDRRGEVAQTWRIGGPTQGLPASYFIDGDGVVQKVVWGAIKEKDLSEGLGLIIGQN